MRIVLLGPAYPFRGGVSHFTGVLASELHRAGHETAIINFEALVPRWFFPSRRRSDDSPHAVRVASQRILVPWRSRTWRHAGKAIELFAPDLIGAMWWQPLLAPALLGVMKALPPELRKRWVYVVHDVVSHERWPGDRWLARSALREAQRFVVLSRSEERRLRNLLPNLAAESIHYSPHPPFSGYRRFAGTADEARRQLDVSAPKVLLFFGFVRRYKGLDILLHALPRILKSVPDLKLLMTGPFQQNRARFERLIERLGIGGAVVIHDRYFSGDELPLCFAAADAVVLPYRTATQSGVVAHAHSLDTPVIATRVGGFEEVVEDGRTGYLVPPRDPEALAEAVIRFYAAGGKTAFLEEIRTAVVKSSWDAFIACLTQLFAEVAGHARQR
jgi:D-inositol-3-phosphate glycosyltransferase